MIDLFWLLFEIWWKGGIVMFVGQGLYMGISGADGEFGRIMLNAFLWPIVVPWELGCMLWRRML